MRIFVVRVCDNLKILACGAVRCGAVRCGAVRCGAVRCGAVRYGAVRCGTVRYGFRFLIYIGRCGAVWFGKYPVKTRTAPHRTVATLAVVRP